MAADLAEPPTEGIIVQACGDAHLMNFGSFATPERNLVFDINDFDETLPGPWEWDVKRLAASIVLAGRDVGIGDAESEQAAVACARRTASGWPSWPRPVRSTPGTTASTSPRPLPSARS